MASIPRMTTPSPGEWRPVDAHAAQILRYFSWQHLPPQLQAVSRPIADLAREMATTLPAGPELTTGLRKLLESKDCFVRAALDKPPSAKP